MLSKIKESKSNLKAEAMIVDIICDLDAINVVLRNTVKLAEKAGDVATVNLLEIIADGQEKTLWMLKSYLA